MLADRKDTSDLLPVRQSCYITQHEGDHRRAIELAREALGLARGRGDQCDIATALTVLAGSIGMTGQSQRAAHLPGAIDVTLRG
jgi:hypothetical protein